VSARDPALDTAGRFARFLDKTIKELKPVSEVQLVRTGFEPVAAPAAKPVAPVNKFAELAERVARTKKALDVRADKLSARLDSFDTKADVTFSKHESSLDIAEDGMDALENSLSGLIGHNGAPNES
jgi:hypothetical protein